MVAGSDGHHAARPAVNIFGTAKLLPHFEAAPRLSGALATFSNIRAGHFHEETFHRQTYGRMFPRQC